MKSLNFKDLLRGLSLVVVFVFLSSFTLIKIDGDKPAKESKVEETTLTADEQNLLNLLEVELPEYSTAEITLEQVESLIHIVYNADGEVVFEDDSEHQMPNAAEYLMTLDGFAYYLMP